VLTGAVWKFYLHHDLGNTWWNIWVSCWRRKVVDIFLWGVVLPMTLPKTVQCCLWRGCRLRCSRTFQIVSGFLSTRRNQLTSSNLWRGLVVTVKFRPSESNQGDVGVVLESIKMFFSNFLLVKGSINKLESFQNIYKYKRVLRCL
jgi:hypothetical protein